MFVKVFAQILDSSIASDYQLRHFFEDMLKLADKTGVVDMTADAISRRINLPLEKVRDGLRQLQEPDPQSRSTAKDGRRIELLSAGRTWGWRIINYEAYRAIRDEEARREYNRQAKRKERSSKRKTGAKLTPYAQVHEAHLLNDENPTTSP